MKIDILGQPDPDIFRDRKKYTLWFAFFLVTTCVGVGVGVFAVYFDTHHYKYLGDWALGILVGSSLGITWFGNRLQAFKRLFPPQLENLAKLRAKHPAIKRYCAEVEATGRRFTRGEYEACVDYSEKHSTVPFI